MKTLAVPFLKTGLDSDLDSLIESGAARFDIDHVCWPEEFPYAPFCGGRIARTGESLLIDFRVSGLDLRVVNERDNGRQWEDSCCEFFVQDPSPLSGGLYYNFEVNAAGKLLACRGTGREGRQPLSEEEFASIVRLADFPYGLPFEREGGIWQWRVALLIPLELIGADSETKQLRANFYKCGDLTAHPHFLSWSAVETARPDFHRPEFFGTLELL